MWISDNGSWLVVKVVQVCHSPFNRQTENENFFYPPMLQRLFIA
jgi:hypothetical protein